MTLETKEPDNQEPSILVKAKKYVNKKVVIQVAVGAAIVIAVVSILV